VGCRLGVQASGPLEATVEIKGLIYGSAG
jgi:hypothetical protein